MASSINETNVQPGLEVIESHALPDEDMESSLGNEEGSSLLSKIGKLLDFFSLSKAPQDNTSPPILVGVGSESYQELYRHIAAVRYEVVSLRAQLGAFQRMSEWTDQVALQTLRRPDLEKVGGRLSAKEKELEGLLNEQIVLENANFQYAKVEAIRFEEDYLKYLITEILDKGNPESPLTSELISTLGTLKRKLSAEEEALDSIRVLKRDKVSDI